MKPSVIREICGTESGYRKHRREDEKRCEECTVAHNEHRRKTYNPDKQRAHKKKYEEKVIKPARIARKKAQEEARAKKKAEIEARKEERRQRGILYKQEQERRRIAHQKKLLAIAERKRIEREGVEQRKAEKALLREKKLLEAENKRIAREERKQRSLERQARLAAEKEAKALEKAKKQEMLNNQHGVTVGDYDRCRKNNNGNACGLCKGVVNAYVSQKSKEPAYKDREKEWRKNNPHRRPHSNRERAIKRGVPTQYYTRQQIIDRDGMDCYLCHLPLDFEANHVQGQPGWELYPHVEHVVPLAKGGHDILDNVKLAHAKCNIDKGVKLIEKATV